MSIRLAAVGSLEDLEAIESGEATEQRTGVRKVGRPREMSQKRKDWLQKQRNMQTAYKAECKAKGEGRSSPPPPAWMSDPSLLPKRPPGKS